MKALEFIKQIALPIELQKIVMLLIEKNYDRYNRHVNNLTNYEKAVTEFELIKNIYKDDLYSYEILSIYILASLKSYELYKEIGISDEVFFDTFKCITRFSYECEKITKKMYFDRDFWVIRQLSLRIFRLGTLEYEFIDGEKKYISIHIPSDALLDDENIVKSLDMLSKFVSQYFKSFQDVEIICDSWLLSPELSKYLDSDSRILNFQKYFKIIKSELEDMGFIRWVFYTLDFDNIDAFPTDTSLQTKIKQALKNGAKIGKSLGVLKK